MRYTLTAILISLALVGNVRAEGGYSQGDGAKMPGADGDNARHYVAPATSWASEPHSSAVILSEGTTQEIIDREHREYIAARRAAYEALIQDKGCNSDFLPPDVAAACWDFRSDSPNRGTVPTGGQIGASQD